MPLKTESENDAPEQENPAIEELRQQLAEALEQNSKLQSENENVKQLLENAGEEYKSLLQDHKELSEDHEDILKKFNSLPDPNNDKTIVNDSLPIIQAAVTSAFIQRGHVFPAQDVRQQTLPRLPQNDREMKQFAMHIRGTAAMIHAVLTGTEQPPSTEKDVPQQERMPKQQAPQRETLPPPYQAGTAPTGRETVEERTSLRPRT